MFFLCCALAQLLGIHPQSYYLHQIGEWLKKKIGTVLNSTLMIFIPFSESIKSSEIQIERTVSSQLHFIKNLKMESIVSDYLQITEIGANMFFNLLMNWVT